MNKGNVKTIKRSIGAIIVGAVTNIAGFPVLTDTGVSLENIVFCVGCTTLWVFLYDK